MKDFDVSRSSWHWRMNRAVFSGSYRNTMSANFCWYWRMTMWGIFHVLFNVGFYLVVAFVLSLLTALAGTSIAHAFMADFSGTAIYVGKIIGFVVGLFAGLFAIGWSANKYSAHVREQQADPNYKPGLVKTKYRAFKDKYCPAVNIVD